MNCITECIKLMDYIILLWKTLKSGLLGSVLILAVDFYKNEKDKQENYQWIFVNFSQEVWTFFSKRQEKIRKNEEEGFVLGIQEVAEHLEKYEKQLKVWQLPPRQIPQMPNIIFGTIKWTVIKYVRC